MEQDVNERFKLPKGDDSVEGPRGDGSDDDSSDDDSDEHD
jgi:hypothetical protein